MPCNYQSLPHLGIQTLSPYVPGKPIDALKREMGLTDIIKLASNENPFGCSPQVYKALAAMTAEDIAHYPAYHLHPLKLALAEKWSISEDRITLSNGSDFIFGLLLMLFALGSGKHMLSHDKAFSTYMIQAQTLNVPFVLSPLLDNWEVDIPALIAACTDKTALIFLANPNNPTGILVSHAAIEKLLQSIPETTILVLDEAYYEFAYDIEDKSTLKLLDSHPNLVITRTFSKAYGLAGLRLGYAFASIEITGLLQRIQLPFTINQAAMNAANEALKDQSFLENTIQQTHAGREQMRQGLEALGLYALPSACNFLTFDCRRNGLGIYQALLECGIIVRPLHPYQMADFLRVSIGKAKDNVRFLDALAKILKNL